MKFLGGFLKFLAIFLLIISTMVCTGVAVYANQLEAYLVMGAALLCALFVSLNIWGTGMALSHACKLRKRIEQLEQKVQNVQSVPYAPVPAVQTPAAQIPVAQVPAADPVSRVEGAAEAPAEPAAPAVEQVAPAKNGVRKWLPVIITAGVAVVVIVAVILIMGGRNQQTTDQLQSSEATAAENDDVQVEATRVPENVAAEAISVEPGGVIDNEYFTMSFDSVEILDEYSYRTSDYSTTSLYVEEGYKLLAVRGLFINNGTFTIQDSSFALTATINDVYTVDGYDVSLDFQRSSSFEIDPYTEQEYILHLNIPAELADCFETVTFTIGFNNDLSVPVTVWDMNGNKSVETDQLYSLTSGLFSAGSTGSDTGAAEQNTPSISIGETISTDDYEFTLTNVELTYEVLPPNTSSVYTSYPADSGKVFVHVEAKVKNTMQRDLRIDELFGTSVLYDGKYPYEGFAIVNDGDNRFDWVGSYIAATPLETCTVHGLVECPIEVDESGNSVVVYLALGDTTYEYVLR